MDMIGALPKPVVKKLSNVWLICGGIFGISVFSLASALTAQYAFHLEPCVLCIYQRIPFCITGALGVAGLIFSYRPEGLKKSALMVFLSAITFMAGAIIAFYHTGVELHWWKSALEGCAVNLDAGAADLMKLIESKPAVRCDEIPWADPFFGLSMANYNAMMSFALSIGCLFSSILIARKANGLID